MPETFDLLVVHATPPSVSFTPPPESFWDKANPQIIGNLIPAIIVIVVSFAIEARNRNRDLAKDKMDRMSDLWRDIKTVGPSMCFKRKFIEGAGLSNEKKIEYGGDMHDANIKFHDSVLTLIGQCEIESDITKQVKDALDAIHLTSPADVMTEKVDLIIKLLYGPTSHTLNLLQIEHQISLWKFMRDRIKDKWESFRKKPKTN